MEKLKKALLISMCMFLFFACTFNALSNIALGVAVALSLYIAYKEHKFKEIYQHTIFKYMLALWLALFVASCLCETPIVGIMQTLKVYTNRMMTFFMVLFLAKDNLKKQVDWLLWSGIGSLVVTSAVAIWQFMHGDMRPGGLTGHPIRLGTYYCLFLPIMLIVISEGSLLDDLKKKVGFSLATGICLAGFLVNNTRGAWLAVGITSIICITILGMRNKSILAGGLAVLLLCGVTIWSVPRFNSRTTSINNAITDTRGGNKVTDERWHIWRSAVHMIADKPILGHGIASFNKEYNQKYIIKNGWIAGDLGHAHNIFLHLWVEGGIFSLLGYLCLMLKLAYDGYIAYFRQHSVYGLIIAGAVISVLLNGLTEFNAVYFKAGFMLLGGFYLLLNCNNDKVNG